MYRIYLFFFFLNFYVSGLAQQYKPADEGSKVHFVIKNFGINTGGDIKGLLGEIYFIPSNLLTSNFNVSVDVNTIDTDNETRDGHLKGKDYLDAENFPLITFTSSNITRTPRLKNWYFFTGTITMHGVTKSIVFPFTAIAKGADYLFKGWIYA